MARIVRMNLGGDFFLGGGADGLEKQQSGCRKRRSARGVRSPFSFSVTFESYFLTLLSLCSSPFCKLLLLDSFCARAPKIRGENSWGNSPGQI